MLVGYLLIYGHDKCLHKTRQRSIQNVTMPRPRNPKGRTDNINLRLTKEEKEKLRKYAERENITMTEAIQRFIEGLNID